MARSANMAKSIVYVWTDQWIFTVCWLVIVRIQLFFHPYVVLSLVIPNHHPLIHHDHFLSFSPFPYSFAFIFPLFLIWPYMCVFLSVFFPVRLVFRIVDFILFCVWPVVRSDLTSNLHLCPFHLHARVDGIVARDFAHQVLTCPVSSLYLAVSHFRQSDAPNRVSPLNLKHICEVLFSLSFFFFRNNRSEHNRDTPCEKGCGKWRWVERRESWMTARWGFVYAFAEEWQNYVRFCAWLKFVENDDKERAKKRRRERSLETEELILLLIHACFRWKSVLVTCFSVWRKTVQLYRS